MSAIGVSESVNTSLQKKKKKSSLRNSCACLLQAFLLPVEGRWLWAHLKKPQTRVTDTGAHFTKKTFQKAS